MKYARTSVGSSAKLVLTISGNAPYRMLRAVLAYEAEKRGRSLGQACYELVMEAIEQGDYPEELRTHLADLEEEARRRALMRSLEGGPSEDDGTRVE